MLGEGYDHPYLSIAAIFRPFKAELPYIQFIGRILRYIEDEEATPIDNIGQIISHKNLELDNLWTKYKKEIEESEIIKRLINDEKIDDLWDDNIEDISDESNLNKNIIDFGQAYEYGDGTLITDSYINTELMKKAKEKESEEQEKVEALKELLGVTEDQARIIYRSTNSVDLSYKRPDMMYLNSKSGLDKKIKGEIVPELITEFKINPKGNELAQSPLFTSRKYGWIPNKVNHNDALLAVFFNSYLKAEIGSSRDKWSQDDFKIAYQNLEKMVQYIKNMLQKRKDEN